MYRSSTSIRRLINPVRGKNREKRWPGCQHLVRTAAKRAIAAEAHQRQAPMYERYPVTNAPPSAVAGSREICENGTPPTCASSAIAATHAAAAICVSTSAIDTGRRGAGGGKDD